MSTQTTITLTETLGPVKICYRNVPIEGSFLTYKEARESLDKNLKPGEWEHYSIAVTKSIEKTYRFVEGR